MYILSAHSLTEIEVYIALFILWAFIDILISTFKKYFLYGLLQSSHTLILKIHVDLVSYNKLSLQNKIVIVSYCEIIGFFIFSNFLDMFPCIQSINCRITFN